MPAPAQAQAPMRKVALVIGNVSYQYASHLRNPANDARLIAAKLSAIGFEVVGGGALVDLNHDQFRSATRLFAARATNADVALVYYSGHGVQTQGRNFLIPTDANPQRASDMPQEAVDAQDIINQMAEGRARLKIMILDACRNDPFKGLAVKAMSGGLRSMSAPIGTLISFATAPDTTAADGAGTNSPFALALAEYLPVPRLDLLNLFNQVGVRVSQSTQNDQIPWFTSSPMRVFYLAGDGTATPAPVRIAAVARRVSTVCNKTASRVSFAVAYATGSTTSSQGWWNLDSGNCVRPLLKFQNGDITRLYLHATSAGKVLALGSPRTFCGDTTRAFSAEVADKLSACDGMAYSTVSVGQEVDIFPPQASATPAPSKFYASFCNKASEKIRLGVAYESSGIVYTEGWWTIAPGNCLQPSLDHPDTNSAYHWFFAKGVSSGLQYARKDAVRRVFCTGSSPFTTTSANADTAGCSVESFVPSESKTEDLVGK